MPYQIHFDGEFLITQLSGHLAAGEFLELAKELEEKEKSLQISPHRVADLSEMKGANLDFRKMAEFASARRASQLKNKVKSAIIAPHDFQYGLARMFQTLSDHAQIEIRLFRQSAEAWAWLKEKQP